MKTFASLGGRQGIVGLAVVCALVGSTAFGTTVTVTPSNMNGWSFLTTDNSGDPAPGNGNTAQMVTGPATPPLGVGSAQLATAANQGDTSSQITTDSFDGTLLSSLTTLSYYTYDTTNNGQQFPYLKLSLSNGDALFFEPPYQTASTGNSSLPDQGATVLDEWQSWNALEGGWWNDNGDFQPGAGPDGVNSIADYLTLDDNSGVTITGISLRVGYASPSDNFNGYVDDVSIGTADGTTTYDFEPDISTPDKVSTLAILGLGLGVLAFGRNKKLGSLQQSGMA